MRTGLAPVVPALLFASLVLGGSPILAQTDSPPAAASAPADTTLPKRIGGSVSPPTLIHQVDPQFSEASRAAKAGGVVTLNLWVDEQGNPTHIRVVRGVGMGLDEKAVEAVKQYKFRPAMENGKPVTVELNIQVKFQIFDKKPAAANASPPATGWPDTTVEPPQDPKAANPPAPAIANGGGAIVSTAPLSAATASAGPVPEYLSDPKFQKALAEAKEKKLPVDERLARWKNANKIAKNQCVECLHQIIYWQVDQSQWKDAIASATQLAAVTTDRREKYFAESERGLALMHSNDGNPKPEQLNEAEASLRAALEIAPKSKTIVYAEGRALAMMGKDDEASAMFQRYVNVVGYADSYRTRAEHFVENPRLAAMRMAPPFTLTTSEGEQMSLDDMGGKVVLLDFWATWCEPCKVALPEIQRIAKDFAGQPLVVISISGDADDIAWKTFIAKNHMTWPQFRDANGALRNAYGVSTIPRYFTIDTDGALKSVKVGSDADVSGDIHRLVNKARDAEKKKAKDSDRAATGE